MNTCIVGTATKGKTDLELIEAAKKMGSVLFVPINNLAIMHDDSGFFVKYRNKDLSKFDAVLFKVPKSKYQLAYYIIKHLDEKKTMMQSRFSFLRSSSRLALQQALSKEGIKVPKSIYAEDVETIKANIKLFKFPVLIKVTDKNRFMLANSEQELKSMIDTLQTLKQPVIIEEFYTESDLFRIYIIENEVIANFKIKNPEINYSGGEAVECRSIRRIVNTALSACKAVKTEIGIISIINAEKPIVVDVKVCPFFDGLKKDYSGRIMDRLKELSEHTGSTSLISQFIDEFKTVLKEKFK